MRAGGSLRSCAAAVFALLAFAAPPAAAHQVWLEANAKGAKLYFGEFADNQREVSPGYLDKLGAPTARRIRAGKEQSLPVRKTRDAFAFDGRLAPKDSVVAVDLAYPVMENKSGDKPRRTIWTPAARYVGDLSARKPVLPLDIVPTGRTGEFLVSYRGAPLARAEATLVAISGWSKSERTDAEGKVSFTLPWKGRYALLVRHKDPTPGKRKTPAGADENYEAASFATTLSFETQTGLPSPPAPPAAPPNPMPSGG